MKTCSVFHRVFATCLENSRKVLGGSAACFREFLRRCLEVHATTKFRKSLQGESYQIWKPEIVFESGFPIILGGFQPGRGLWSYFGQQFARETKRRPFIARQLVEGVPATATDLDFRGEGGWSMMLMFDSRSPATLCSPTYLSSRKEREVVCRPVGGLFCKLVVNLVMMGFEKEFLQQLQSWKSRKVEK